MNITLLKFDELSSTNTEAIEQAKRGAEEGLCIVAGKQTAGRGRHGRNWSSERDSGLYFSIVLRPTVDIRFFPLLTLVAAVAVYDVLENVYQIKSDIKWPNDILINEKKVCGILAESIETSKGLSVIIGIGINLSSSNFPAEVRDRATSIEQEINLKPTPDEFSSALTRFFSYFYEIFQNADGAKIIRNRWAKRSSYFEGKHVRVVLENEAVYGTTCGLEETGALRIRVSDDEIKIVQAGDVEQLRQT